MTTLAYRAGILAADSQATDSQRWGCQKLFDIDTTAGRLLVGICGEMHAAMVFIEWLKDNASRKPDIPHEDFCSIVVASNGRVTIWNNSLVPWRPKGSFFAIGSGGEAAMGAMHAGKSAIDAVKIAKKVDPYTGGRVVHLKLSQKRKAG